MLIFNKNIYEAFPNAKPNDVDPYAESYELDAYSFLLNVLSSDRQIFIGLEHMSHQEASEHLKTLFPHACKFGNLAVLNDISKRLLEGLVNRDHWYRMNAYHFCYLYDSLYSLMEEYNYSSLDQRMEMCPEMAGNAIDFNKFLNEYFFNTAFLIHTDRFNNMLPQEKQILGLEDSCLFGVINHLIPTREEIKLNVYSGDPYVKSD